MKKFSIVFALIVSVSAMAQTPAFNRIRINLQNTTTSKSDWAYLVECPGYTSEFENSFDIIKGFLAGDIFVYSVTAAGRQSDYFNSTLADLPIGYWNKTASPATLKFTFSEIQHDLEGEFNYYLLDKTTNSRTLITAGNSYIFTATANEQNDTRFVIIKPDFHICATFDHVQIYDNLSTQNVVITNMAGDTVVNVAPVAVFQDIDLSDQPAGQYTINYNGGEKKYIIAVKPVVETETPTVP